MTARARKSKSQMITAAVVGTHLPRRCGIGTFTSDLCDALTGNDSVGNVLVVALNDTPEGYPYPDRVRFVIQETVRSDYRLASDFLNINELDVVILQHEYGIFGGPAGAYVLMMLRDLRMPVITTLHTVLSDPSQLERRVMLELAELSQRLVVMSQRAVDILIKEYGVPKKRVVLIHHGIPDVPFIDPAFYKDKFGLEDRKVILTFGLLSPGKGIEHMLEAMPEITKHHPDAMYVLLGPTHPNIVREHGEEYRQKLATLVKQNGLREHVSFQNRFVSIEELVRYIGAADVYVTPYLNQAQVVSGTLAFTLGAGRAVVSTPYWYAKEMLADGRGRLVPFADSQALAEQVVDLFDHPKERNRMRKRAYDYCRSMVWSESAKGYVKLARQVLAERRRHPRTVVPAEVETAERVELELPEPDLRHLRNMTDGTGILQHATYGTPDRQHGYTTDDNARALIAAMLSWHVHRDDTVLPMIQTYLAFINDAFNRKHKRFRNFMSYQREWLEDVGSEDSHARATWALGVATAKAPNDSVRSMAARLFCEALPASLTLKSPRAWAYVIVGIHAYLECLRGDADARRTRDELAQRLLAHFTNNATPEWPWCEDVVTYSNARLPHALLLSGRWVPNAQMTEQALRSLEWLLKVQTGEDGQLSMIGNQGWMKRDGTRARFDQQPVEVMGLVDACSEAYRITGETRWLNEAQRCMDWFFGRNDLEVPLYDFSTGGCGDGLSPHGPNANRGAESTLAWLISLTTMHELLGTKTLRTIGSAD